MSSTTSKAAATTASAAAVSEREEELPGRIIAIAIDNSDFSEKAFHWYRCSMQRRGDFLVLIHCPEFCDFSVPSSGIAKQLLHELQDHVSALEQKYREKLCSLKMNGIFRTGSGKPGEVIVDIAKQENVVMIITGSRGLGKIRRTVLGSVSDYVVHHASVPVLVCHV